MSESRRVGRWSLRPLLLVVGGVLLWGVMFLGGVLFIEVEYTAPAGASPATAVPPATAISPLAALRLRGEGALVVDVRTPEEFVSGHLEGAINIPHDQVPDRLAEFGAERGRPIVVYCRSGRRSRMAQVMLTSAGYTGVRNGGSFEALVGALRSLGDS